MKPTIKLWIGLAVLAILSPLGLLLPLFFKAGAAWGEWGTDEIKQIAGYVPEKLKKLSELWKAPMPDYSFAGWENKNMEHLSFAYICSAILGIIVIVGISFIIGKLLVKKEEK